MAVYKDKNRGTWYASVLYVDWTGKRCRKLKRGFATKKEAQEWEMHFKLQKASSLDMTFGDFYKIYEQDIKPKVRYNTWCSKQHIIETKLLPYFKDLVMRDITPRDIIQWQNSMREASKKMAENTRRLISRQYKLSFLAFLIMQYVSINCQIIQCVSQGR